MWRSSTMRRSCSLGAILALALGAGALGCSSDSGDGGRDGSTIAGGRGGTGGTGGAGGSGATGGNRPADAPRASDGRAPDSRVPDGRTPDGRPADRAPSVDRPAADTGGAVDQGSGAAIPFTLTVGDVDTRNGMRYFRSGQTNGTGNRSPSFQWTEVPGAMSYAITMFDSSFQDLTHWVIRDIPATVRMLPANLMRGMFNAPEIPGAKHSGFNNMAAGYFGPGGNGCNTYIFEVHALRVATLPVMGNVTDTPARNNLRTVIIPANRISSTAPVSVIGRNSAVMCN
jgi:phosphatidylethanolamine-binding protein (PEBP) family uncharacterized protein